MSEQPTLKTRLRMALSEAGYPYAAITGSVDHPSVDHLDEPGGVPSEVCWKAFRVAGCEVTPECFDCWSDGYDESECPHPRSEVTDA